MWLKLEFKVDLLWSFPTWFFILGVYKSSFSEGAGYSQSGGAEMTLPNLVVPVLRHHREPE